MQLHLMPQPMMPQLMKPKRKAVPAHNSVDPTAEGFQTAGSITVTDLDKQKPSHEKHKEQALHTHTYTYIDTS